MADIIAGKLHIKYPKSSGWGCRRMAIEMAEAREMLFCNNGRKKVVLL
jgi:hypothetical protein